MRINKLPSWENKNKNKIKIIYWNKRLFLFSLLEDNLLITLN